MWRGKTSLYICALLVLLVSSPRGFAGDFEGSGTLICAVIETHGCAPNEDCLRGSAEGINVPRFFRVDLSNRTITSTKADGTVQRTDIQRIERLDGMIILQGVQNARAWSATILVPHGDLVLTASAGREAFLVFGACTRCCE